MGKKKEKKKKRWDSVHKIFVRFLTEKKDPYIYLMVAADVYLAGGKVPSVDIPELIWALGFTMGRASDKLSDDDRIKISKAIEMLDTQIAEKEVAMQKTHEENSLSDIIEAGMKIE